MRRPSSSVMGERRHGTTRRYQTNAPTVGKKYLWRRKRRKSDKIENALLLCGRHSHDRRVSDGTRTMNRKGSEKNCGLVC